MRKFKSVKIFIFISSLFQILLFTAIVNGQTDENTLQTVKSTLFGNVLTLYKDAKTADAELLSPKAFSEGVNNYNKASNDFKKQKSLDDVRKNINLSEDHFKRAIENSKLASLALGSVIQARKDAGNVEANKYAAKIWEQSEEKFRDSIKELENGDMNNSKKRATEAEQFYRNAELEAIKINYLDETYELIEKAKQQKVKDLAPKTLAKAQNYIAEAEKELTENRYDTDVVAVLARQAKREANHAIFIADYLKKCKDAKETSEDILLYNEKHFADIAGPFDIIPDFSLGLENFTNTTVEKIEKLQKDNERLNQSLSDSEEENALLNDKIAEMEKENAALAQKIGGVEKEKSQLTELINKQAKLRELYNAVEQLFGAEEALLVRKGNNINIRLAGLSFSPGKSVIEPRYNTFLSKVVKAIDLFPNSKVKIEGHTDSFGSDEANLSLSVERAESVRQYLIANSQISPERIEAVGYGESKPLSTNDSEQGRANNRRIEMILLTEPDNF